MTNEEMDRAIDFVLKSQASLDARIERTNEQLAELSKHLSEFADTQAGIMRVMTRTFEAQAQINDSLRAALTDTQAEIMQVMTRTSEAQAQINDSLRAALTDTQTGFVQVMTRTSEAQAQINDSLHMALSELATRQSRTEEALTRLADAQLQTDRRMNELIDIVKDGRNSQ